MAPPSRRIWDKGAELFEKAKSYAFGTAEPLPPISERTALLCAIAFTVLYVAPFYISPTLRASSLNSRDSPPVIKARIRAVAFSCMISTAIAGYVLTVYGHAGPWDVLRLFAMWPIAPLDCLNTLGLVCVLFIGPLYETFVVESAWRRVSFSNIKETLWTSLPSFRNYVMAPFSEELVFRSLVVSLYLLAKVSPLRIVFTTPLIFGVAHIHHFVEFVQARTPPGRTMPPGNVFLMGAVTSLFQFAYTSLFGFFAAFVYLRTGNVWASIVAHSFCNFMGFPRIWGKLGQVEEWPTYDLTPDVGPGKRDDSLDQVRVGNSLMQGQEDFRRNEKSGGRGIGWTIAYYILLVAGAFGFYRLLWPMTRSANALESFSKD